jgi:hypothetical protein
MEQGYDIATHKTAEKMAGFKLPFYFESKDFLSRASLHELHCQGLFFDDPTSKSSRQSDVKGRPS